MHDFLRSLALAAALVAHAGCMNVSPPGAFLASEPPGARVRVDGQDSGWVTPCQIALDIEETHTVTIAMEGYDAEQVVFVPEERRGVISWLQGVNGVRSTIRFPILLPAWEFLIPFRVVDSHAPGRVFVRLRPADSP